MFRRVFVCFKACWKEFLDGCRPYLAVDATALNERFRGQFVAATAIDAHNWLFLVAYGVLETESIERWIWFLQNLCQVIGCSLEWSIGNACDTLLQILARYSKESLMRTYDHQH
jgi:hypothetical protein